MPKRNHRRINETKIDSEEERELMTQFVKEFKELCDETSEIAVFMQPIQLWSVLSAIQLAMRHPKFPRNTREIVEPVARQIQACVAHGGALAVIAERGWHREWDESPVDKS